MANEEESVGVAGSSGAPPSPTMHQVLEMEDDYLPGKLADIINKCVECETLNSDLPSATLDSILNMTQSEPAFEGLLQGQTSNQLAAVQAPPTSEQPTLEDVPYDHTSVQLTPPATGLTGLAGSSQQTDVGSGDMNHGLMDGSGPPLAKKPKMTTDDEEERRFPTDQDFLDNLHGQ